MSSVEMLVVDDDAALRTALGRALRGAGYLVREAADGAAALRSIGAKPPALLITDIMMPDSDGIALIGEVRRRYPDLRILAISGRGNFGGLDLLNLAGMIGADATLSKPLSPEELLDKVAGLVCGAS
jgi:DNA-binding response OmpR family regulator